MQLAGSLVGAASVSPPLALDLLAASRADRLETGRTGLEGASWEGTQTSARRGRVL